MQTKYLDDAKRGQFKADLHRFLESQLNEALKFESLFIVGNVADRCGEIVAELVVEEQGKRLTATNAAKQVQSAWYLGYFCGEVELEGLRADAKEITERKLRNLAKEWRKCWENVCDADEKLAKLPKWDEHRREANKALDEATERYQSARTALLKFIGPKSEQFEPGNNYVDIWRRECNDYEAERAKRVKSEGRGRGVLPNGDAIRNNRDLKGLTQEELAREVSLNPRTVRRMESMESVQKIDWKSILRVAEFFGVEPESLVRDAPGGGGGGKPDSRGGSQMLACSVLDLIMTVFVPGPRKALSPARG